MKQLCLFMIVMMLKAGLPLHGQPYNFTFRIPVELHSIPPEIKTCAISVQIYDRPFNGDYPFPGSMIGYGDTGFTIVNGEFNDSVTVAFNELLRKDPHTAVYWSADLLLYGPAGYQGGCLVAMGADTPYPYNQTKPLVCRVHGPIPPPAAPPPAPPVMKKVPSPHFEKGLKHFR